jgi:hypothetical protein
MLEPIDWPEKASQGEKITFRIKTLPQSTCGAAIKYWSNQSGKWVGYDLPEIMAGSDGICQWDWTVPSDADPGQGEFRIAVNQGRKSKDIIPYQFCIGECPEPTIPEKEESTCPPPSN